MFDLHARRKKLRSLFAEAIRALGGEPRVAESEVDAIKIAMGMGIQFYHSYHSRREESTLAVESGSMRLWWARSGSTILPFSIPMNISVTLRDGLLRENIGPWMQLKQTRRRLQYGGSWFKH